MKLWKKNKQQNELITPGNLDYPIEQTSSGDEVMQLFPIPVLICPYPVNYDEELEWIRNCECKKEHSADRRQSEDTFVLDRPELAKVRAFIEFKIHHYVTKIWSSNDKLVITQSWLNKSKKGESHVSHQHPNSMISGVWYPQIHEQMPPIQFMRNGQRDVSLSIDQFNTFNSATFVLPVKKGELILFPSNIFHSVPANKDDEERISLSFNTWVKGNLGDIAHKTYVPLDRCI